MARPFTVTILKPDGTAWSGGKFTVSLREGFAGVDEVVSPYTIEYTLDTNGQIATQPIALETPPTGTAHYLFGEPGGDPVDAYLESGSAVDYSTLKTVASAAVDQDAAQTLFDQSEDITITEDDEAYTILATDELVLLSGTLPVYLPAAGQNRPVFIVKNTGVGQLTATPNGADTIDGLASLIIYPGQAYAFVDVAAGRYITL